MDSPPTSPIARTRRFGGLVAGQGLRWAGTRAANALRSDEAADAATGERAAATARELVKQLGQSGYGEITTEIADAGPFYYAEDYHQQYLAKNPNGYCGLGGTGVSCPIGLTAR